MRLIRDLLADDFSCASPERARTRDSALVPAFAYRFCVTKPPPRSLDRATEKLRNESGADRKED
jgi:hypothetical protein